MSTRDEPHSSSLNDLKCGDHQVTNEILGITSEQLRVYLCFLSIISPILKRNTVENVLEETS